MNRSDYACQQILLSPAVKIKFNGGSTNKLIVVVEWRERISGVSEVPGLRYPMQFHGVSKIGNQAGAFLAENFY